MTKTATTTGKNICIYNVHVYTHNTKIHTYILSISHVLYSYIHTHKLILSYWASLMTKQYRICLQMQETWVRSLGGEDPVEEEMATPSSILAWEVPWTEGPVYIHINVFLVTGFTFSMNCFISFKIKSSD